MRLVLENELLSVFCTVGRLIDQDEERRQENKKMMSHNRRLAER